MESCFFVSDLHGITERYEKLFQKIKDDRPSMVFFGGDLLPHGIYKHPEDNFTLDFLLPGFLDLKMDMDKDYPHMLIILGNDDPGLEGPVFKQLEQEHGIWNYMHLREFQAYGYSFYGYSYIPPSPFRFKDWERYDVSRYIDPGCISPEEGIRTVDPGCDIEYTTIQGELEALSGKDDMTKAVFLFHSPPYETYLDRAALDGKMVDYVPLDVHVGSIAIKRMIEERQPWITLHGHIHESTRLTGHWSQELGRTHAFNAAHDGPELSLIAFDLDRPGDAQRLLL